MDNKIPTKEIIEYVRGELANHVPNEQIIQHLSVAGWPPEVVHKIIDDVGRLGFQDKTKPMTPRHQFRRIIWILFFGLVAFLVIAYILGGS